MNKDITFSEQCDNSSLDLSLFGFLLASTDTVARDDVLEASWFRKNRHNWIFIFQELRQFGFSHLINLPKVKVSHQIVTRYVVSFSYFELDDKKSPIYDTWWLLVT